MLRLDIELKQSSISLFLADTEKTIDLEVFSYYHDLDQKLINGLDKLLKRNSIDVNSVKSYKILDNIGENATSHKIVQAFIEGLRLKA